MHSADNAYGSSALVGLPPYAGYLAAKADAKGMDLSELVNDLLKKDIELIEAAK